MTHQTEFAPALHATSLLADAPGLVNDVCSLIEAMSTIQALLEVNVQSASVHELSKLIAEAMVTFPGFDHCRILLTMADGKLDCRAQAKVQTPVVNQERAEDNDATVNHRGSHAFTWALPNMTADGGDIFDENTSTFSVALSLPHNHSGVIQVHTVLDLAEIPLIKPLMILSGQLVEKLYEAWSLIHTLDQAVAEQTKKLSKHTELLLSEVDEHKRTQQIVEKERQRMVDFAEVAADWFWETDNRLRFTYISDRFEILSGMSRDNILGTTLLDFVNIVRGSGWQGCIENVKHKRGFKNFLFMSKIDERKASVFNICGKPGFDSEGNFAGYRGVGQDVTQTHGLIEELAYHAQHDSLTGLQNRCEFEHSLTNALAKSRMDGSTSVLCYLDLDQFKVINDTCGHSAGDELLCQVSQLLQQNTRDSDVVARLGGDEFGLLLRSCSLEKGAAKAHNLRRMIQQHRFVWEDSVFSIGASIGVIPITPESGSVERILSAVDTACYMPKHNGRGRIHVEDENSAELIQWRRDMEWVSKINWALENDRFELNHQAIIPVDDSSSHDGVIYEILIRMIDESGNIVMPGAFLPAAEQYSMVTKIDYWVVGNTLRWLSNHQTHLDSLHMCCINLSGYSISDSDFMKYLSKSLDRSSVPAHKVCFEVTETALISDLRKTRRYIDALRDKGCRFALDDFGSGVSSFAYLKTLPVDFVKIDGIFAKDIEEKPVNFEILKTINEVSHAMGKKTIAEYVEKESTLKLLRVIGVDYAQGFFIGKPKKLTP